jgi:hypothetical protein
MRIILFTITFLLFISCADSCDLQNYPSAPYNEPYNVEYGNDWVKYVYLCRNGYNNEIVTYQIVGDCWETYTDYQYNYYCN